MLPIYFSSSDPTPPGWVKTNPLVIVAKLEETLVHRVHIDNGSTVEVMYEHCYKQLPEAWRRKLRRHGGCLTGFGGHDVIPIGTIKIPLTMEDYRKRGRKTVELEFMVVRAPSRYNLILGRVAIMEFGAVVSTIHGVVKFPDNGKRMITVVAYSPEPLMCNQIMNAGDMVTGIKRKRESGSEH